MRWSATSRQAFHKRETQQAIELTYWECDLLVARLKPTVHQATRLWKLGGLDTCA